MALTASGVPDFLVEFQKQLAVVQNTYPTMKEEVRQQLAIEMTKQELNKINTSGVSVREFSRFSAEEAPDTYLKKFEDEANMAKITDVQKFQVFPSLMTGRATPVVPTL